jgi:hypothetical protein
VAHPGRDRREQQYRLFFSYQPVFGQASDATVIHYIYIYWSFEKCVLIPCRPSALQNPYSSAPYRSSVTIVGNEALVVRNVGVPLLEGFQELPGGGMATDGHCCYHLTQVAAPVIKLFSFNPGSGPLLVMRSAAERHEIFCAPLRLSLTSRAIASSL